MAIEMASMCLREEPRYRPDAGDIVLALDYLSSKQYVPKGSGTVSPGSMDIDDSPKETSMILPKDLLREKAVAEAKQWGETWRDKRRQSGQNSPEEIRR
jgi:serine/threonine-protein kinase PBS1